MQNQHNLCCQNVIVVVVTSGVFVDYHCYIYFIYAPTARALQKYYLHKDIYNMKFTTLM